MVALLDEDSAVDGTRRVATPVWLGATLRYVGRRVLSTIPVVVGVIVVTFLLLRLVPGDPAEQVLGLHATPRQIATLRRQLGLNQPLWRQFWHFVDGILHANLGTSIYYHSSVTSLIASRIGTTAALVALASVAAIAITLPLAAISALRQNRGSDHVIRVGSLVGIAMPSFWLGILLAVAFGIHLHWFPVGGQGSGFWGGLRALVLPAICAAAAIAPVLIRSLRASMLDVLDADYIATARAKGIRRWRVTLHVVRNALVPTVSLVAVRIAYLIGGTVIVEQVFDLNGLGTLMLASIQNRDYPVVQGITLVYALAVIGVLFLSDLATARLDPRIRLR